MQTSTRAAAVIGLVLAPSLVHAQTPAVTQNTERVDEEAPSEDTENWTASAGANISSGNTRSYTFNAGTSFSIIRGNEGFAFDATTSYGRAVPAGGTMGFETNARNFQAKARFDHFFSHRHAGFLSTAFRWDTFAGLNARVQAQIGYQYNFIRETNHRLFTEVGYDFTFDDVVRSGIPPMPVDDTIPYHSARLFLGWDNQLSDDVKFKTGLEALMTVDVPEDWRLNWDNTLNVSVGSRLQIELKFTVLYDHQPVQDRRATDTRTTASLVLDMW